MKVLTLGVAIAALVSAGCLVDVPGVGVFQCDQNGAAIQCAQVEIHRPTR